MANTASEKQTFTGRVLKANDTGIVLDSQPDVWLNRSSKGSAAALELPTVGQHVTITATPWKERYYIGAVTINTNGNTPVAAQDGQQVAQEPDRERRISRLAVLNTATAILSHNLAGKPIRAEDLEALAARLEAWTYRLVPLE